MRWPFSLLFFFMPACRASADSSGWTSSLSSPATSSPRSLRLSFAHRTFSLVKFYERRCRRILPALLVMFAVVFVLASAVLLPPDMVAFCRSMLSATLFVSNIYFWKTSTYFEGASQFKPLLHTWSLGVEEQFTSSCPWS